MPAAPQGIAVEPNGQSVVVAITEQGGGTPTVYADRHGQSTIAMPATITTRTTFFLTDPTAFTVSAKVSGLENANGSGGTASVDLTGGGIASIGVSVPTETPTLASATYGLLPSSPAAKVAPSLASVQAISGLKWLFTPASGFFSDQAGTTRQVADGGAVKCWKDASGNADHATTASAGLTLKQGAGSGTDALNVAGSGTRLSTTGVFDSSFNAGFTFLVVVSNPASSSVLVSMSSRDGRLYHAWNGSNNTTGFVTSATSLPAPSIPIGIPTATNVNAPSGAVMIEALRYNGPSVAPDYFFDGYPQNGTAASATAMALTGVLDIGSLGGSFPWGGKILAVAVFNRAISNTEMGVVHNYLSAVCQARPRPVLQLIGNSLTTGVNASRTTTIVPGTSQPGYAKSGNTDYPSVLLDSFPGGDVLIREDAYPGRSTIQINSELPRTTLAQHDPACHGKRIAVVWEITNDLGQEIAGNGTASTNIAALNAGTAPPAYSNLVTLCQTLQAAGFIVGVVTCLPRSDMSTQNSALFYRGYQGINQLLRDNWTGFAHFLVDVAADTRLGLPGAELNTTYFSSDKVHMTDEGYRIVAGMVRAAALPWIGTVAPPRMFLSKSVAGAANVTLSPLDAGTVTQLQGGGVVTLTGALTGNISVFLPLTAGASALFVNNTTGAFTVTLIGASGTGYAITQGKKARAYTDGTNWYQATPEV